MLPIKLIEMKKYVDSEDDSLRTGSVSTLVMANPHRVIDLFHWYAHVEGLLVQQTQGHDPVGSRH